jgi:two-component system, chemotaxis family, sensor kinase CheA
MSTDFKVSITNLVQLTGKIAMELVYAEPGKDIGLLPVNCLLDQIEEICAAAPPPPVLQQAIQLGRTSVDEIFSTTGLFDPESIAFLGEWSNWLTSALEATQDNREFAPLPKAWLERKEPSTEAPTATASPKSEVHEAPPALDVEMPLNVNIDQDAELLREYISESHEHLQNIELGVLVLEENPSDAETLASIFRAFHTFKGGSGLLNLTAVNRLAHDLESLLDLARQNKLAINSDIINLILEGGDALKQYTVAIEAQLNGTQPLAPIIVPTAQLILRVKSVVQAAQNGRPIPALEKAKQAAAQAAAGENAPAEAAHENKGPETASLAHAASMSSPMVKVATPKLDSLVDLVGEMVIAQSLVAQDPSLRAAASGTLVRNLTQLSRITEELQKTAMSLRMVPIRSTFQKMTRLVRDLATKQGKQVELRLHGEDTELDRTIVEQLNDPLVHMIRNAVDHGIEKPEVRATRGKPELGVVELNAFHQGGNIVIEIKDNGGGLNRDRILAKGIEKGLVKQSEIISDAEIYQLIFAPGFSTAETISDVSGRGVGMDVVHRNIEKLRGKVEIQTRLGQGSTFTIYLPLTLAIIDGLMVAIGEQRYIIPTLMVRESFRPTAQMISSVHERGEMVSVRGRLSPLLRLYEYFDIKPQATDPTQAIVVVVGSDHENRCLMVDQLIGKQEVVIKSLGETFKQNRAVAGAAILGDGRVGLILDVDYLLRFKTESVKKAA